MVSNAQRATTLRRKAQEYFVPKRRPLWLSIYYAHSYNFWQGWFVTILQSLMTYAPLLCLFRLLALLEVQQSYTSAALSSSTWFWAIGIGLSSLVQQFLDARFVL